MSIRVPLVVTTGVGALVIIIVALEGLRSMAIGGLAAFVAGGGFLGLDSSFSARTWHGYCVAASYLFSVLMLAWVPAALVVGAVGYENGGPIDQFVSRTWPLGTWVLLLGCVIVLGLARRSSLKLRLPGAYAVVSFGLSWLILARGFHTHPFGLR